MIGGQEIYLYDLADFLIKKGHEVTVIQSGNKDETVYLNGIKIKKIKTTSRILFNLLWKTKIDKNADKIHLHDFEDSFYSGNRKMTATCHGITWDCPTTSLYWLIHNILHKKMAKTAIKKLNKIASVDSFLLRFVQSEMPNFRDKIKVINSYVNTKIFNPKVKGTEIKKQYNNNPIILFPRNMSFVRGTAIILEAMKIVIKEIPNAVLLMTGTGPLKDYAINFIKENKLEKNIFLLGHKDHFKDMPLLYAASDIVVVPSLCREGCSLSALEALAMRKPLIVTNIGGLIDIVINEENGLISDTTHADLAKKIIFLLNNKPEANRLAKNGYKDIKRRFEYKVWCKNYADFFEL